MNKAFVTLFFILFFFTKSFALEKVSLQLKWFHQFQFAGYYAAKEKGFYKDVGLDVEIKERDINFNNIEQVINNKSQYGVADSILLLYRAKNEPVIIVSPIFQHSPSILFTLKRSGINSPYKLNNKDVLFYENDTDGFSILAMLNKLNIKPNLIRKREKNDYTKVLNNEVIASAGYLSNEPFYLRERNIEFNIIDPRNYGFDLYGDMLFTNENEMINHPNRVKRFKDATLKGWRYALENKEEIIKLIHKKYNKTKSVKHLRYEANVIDKLISDDTVPLGSIDEGRIQYISSIYKEFGLTKKDFDIKNFIFENYKNQKNQFTNLSIKEKESKQKNTLYNELTQKETEFLKNHSVIRFKVPSNNPPFSFQENGIAQGVAVDYVKESAKNVGLNVKFVINDDPIFESYNHINTTRKKYDSVLYSVKSSERNVKLSFGIPYLSYPLMIVTNSNNPFISSLKDLKNKTIVLEKRYLTNNWIKKDYPDIKIINAEDTLEALKMLNENKVDAYVGNGLLTSHLSSMHKLENVKIVAPSGYGNVKYSFASPKEWPELSSLLSKGYSKISQLEHNNIRQRWLSLRTIEKVNYTIIWNIILVSIFILAIFLWWNRKLHQEKNKTKKVLEELKKSQKKLIEQHKLILVQSKNVAIGEMIGNIAHQWRQPLSVISTCATGLILEKESGLLNDKRLIKSLYNIHEHTRHLSKTIDTFRNYLNTTKEYCEVIFQDSIKESLRILDSTFKNNFITLKTNIDEIEPIKIKLVKGEFSEVLINILNNAKDVLLIEKVTSPWIELLVKKESDKIIVTIEDNAGGIDPKIIDRIFEPYFTTKHKSQGTGLGLHMSYKIVTESLKGSIYVKNTNNGAKFFIEIPYLNNY